MQNATNVASPFVESFITPRRPPPTSLQQQREHLATLGCNRSVSAFEFARGRCEHRHLVSFIPVFFFVDLIF